MWINMETMGEIRGIMMDKWLKAGILRNYEKTGSI